MHNRIAAGLIVGISLFCRAQMARPPSLPESPSAVTVGTSNSLPGYETTSLLNSAPWELSVPSNAGQYQAKVTDTLQYSYKQVDIDDDRVASTQTGYKASTFVPLDSWIYAAFDMLAAIGYSQTSSASVRPWTRLECARLLAEAHNNVDSDVKETTASVLAALDREFSQETEVIDGTGRNAGAQAESAYERLTAIAGTPLRDGFHFGQTLVDDFGRPYGKGPNSITGISGRVEAGPFAIYLRAEYQYASAIPAYSKLAQQTISGYDGLPFGWNLRLGTTSRVRPIEAYAAVNLANWQISLGQQSLWWGPNRTTSLMMSNNAAPMPMLRLSRVRPVKLGWFGPLHFDAFFSREGGVHYVALGTNFTLNGSPSKPLTPPPYMWGLTFSIKPTTDLELGFSHTVIFAGYGRPLTFGTFFHTFSVLGNGQDIDPGKRATGFSINYRLGGWVKNVVVYNEALAWDDPIEGKFVARFAMAPGVYVAHMPRLKKMDLRMEGAYTNLPKLTYPAYFYSNAHYPQGYTNYGQIIGSWVGRQGTGAQVSSSYWFSARNKSTVTYRRMASDPSFLQGGNVNDFSANLSLLVRPEIELLAMGQYEQWKFPLLGPNTTPNFSAQFEIRMYPKLPIRSH